MNPTQAACHKVGEYMSRSRIYRGMIFSRDEIVLARDELKKHFTAFSQAVDIMAETFDAERTVECKLACEHLALAVRALANRREAFQIEDLAKSLAGTFTTHLARRPRP
jgi:hypothetical protein